MKFVVLLAIVAAVAAVTPALQDCPVATHAYLRSVADEVNSNPNSSWKAEISPRFYNISLKTIARMCGSLQGGAILPMKEYPEVPNAAIPDTFEPEKQWPECAAPLTEIRDQSACGSCWAFGAASAATDRWCIATKGKDKPHFAARDLLSCCSSCGFGCEGGYPSSAWSWLASSGIVTGGNYNKFDSCVSYPMPLCQHHSEGPYPQCSTMSFDTPSCQTQCDAKSTYTVAYSQDKHRFQSGYSLRGEANIQQDVLKYGSVEASFSVYDDFVTYKSGVYRHTTGRYLGGHAVKLVGWGVDNGVKYWKIANSWNESWGEKGYFRIIRGVNDCGIEQGINAGVPRV